MLAKADGQASRPASERSMQANGQVADEDDDKDKDENEKEDKDNDDSDDNYKGEGNGKWYPRVDPKLCFDVICSVQSLSWQAWLWKALLWPVLCV